MPSYDYKCLSCHHRFSLFYKTYSDYDSSHKTCPNCQSDDLTRVIHKVTVAASNRDFTRMSSGEMLNVLESGDSRQVGEMFQQIGGADPRLGAEYHDATKKLLDGESKDSVEKTLKANQESKPAQKPSDG
jgi:putative FmdB family regulatory protein